MSARAGAPGGVSRAARLDDDGGGEGSSSASPSRPASSQAGVAPRPSANTSLPAAAVVADERHPARDDLDQRREQVREASPIGPCSRGRPPAVVDVEKMKQELPEVGLSRARVHACVLRATRADAYPAHAPGRGAAAGEQKRRGRAHGAALGNDGRPCVCACARASSSRRISTRPPPRTARTRRPVPL